MTPTMEAPIAPAVGGGFESSLDSAFTSTAPETEVTEQVQGDETQVDQVQDPPEEQTEDQPITDNDGEQEEFTDDAGRKYYNVKPTRMREFVNAKNFVKELTDIAPTIEHAKAHYQAASDFRALQSDFASAEPAGVQSFMNYWSQGAPEAFQSMATQLPNYLATLASRGDQGSVQALRSIEAQVHRADVATAYDKAAQTKDPQDLYVAQRLDFHHHGKYHESLDKIPVRQQPQQQDQFKQREQQIEQREQQFANQRWNEFDSTSISGAKESALTQAVQGAFKPFEATFAGAPGLMAAAQRQAVAQVQEELTKQFEWNRNQTVEQTDIQRDFLKAIRTGQKTNLDQRAAELVKDYKSRVSRVLPGIVKSLIGERTQTVMQQSQANHNRLAVGAKKIAPGAGGSPAHRSISPPRPNQSVGDRMDDIFRT